MPHALSAAPGISSERAAAVAAGATRLISGFYTARGEFLSVTAYAEDVATQSMTPPVHASGTVLEVAKVLANRLGATQTASLHTNVAALKQYALASDTAGADAARHYLLALDSDPNCGAAYLGLVDHYIAANDRADAQAAIERASAHTAALSARERAYLQLQSATVAGSKRGRADALRALVTLNEGGADILRALADAEMGTRQPAEAAQHYGQLAALVPEDPGVQNLRAYASIAAVDENTARAAAAEYQRLRPQDPNAFDTRGDVEFAFGKFPEAAAIYLASPDANFQNCSPTWKAALARLYAGDQTGAAATFQDHKRALTRSGNPLAGYRDAEWLFVTANKRKAEDAMVSFAAQAKQPGIRSAAYVQAAIWAVLAQENERALAWAQAARQPPEPATFGWAAVAQFLAQPNTTAAGWGHRAVTAFPGQNQQAIRRLALGYALVLNRMPREAQPVWKEIYDSTEVTDAAPQFVYAWTLLETGQQSAAAALLRVNPIPPIQAVPSFEAVYVPSFFEWRKTSLRQ